MTFLDPLSHYLYGGVNRVENENTAIHSLEGQPVAHPETDSKLTELFFGIGMNSESFKERNKKERPIDSNITPLKPINQKLLPIDAEINEDDEDIELENDEQTAARIEELKQSLEKSHTQAILVSDKIDKLWRDFKGLERRCEDWKSNLNGYGNLQGNILATLEYFNVNHDNFLDALNKQLSPEQFSMVEAHLENTDATFKWANCIAPLVFNVVKFCISNQIQKDLDKLHKRLQKWKVKGEETKFQQPPSLFKKIDCIQQAILQLSRELEKEQKSTLSKGRSKLGKLASRLTTFPITYWFEVSCQKANKICRSTFNVYWRSINFFNTKSAYIEQKRWMYRLQSRIVVNINCPNPWSQTQLYREVEQFLKSLDRCKSIDQVKKKLREVKITIPIPSDFEDWCNLYQNQHVRRSLVQDYYYAVGKRPIMNGDHIQSILERRQAEKINKIDESLAFIQSNIDKCQNLTFAQITTHFKNLHIDFNQLKSVKNIPLQLIPKTKDEWDQCIKDPEFCKSLAKEWVDHQETIGQLAMQALRYALLSKNIMEREFLFFRGIEYLISIVSSILQLIVHLSLAKLWVITSVIELLMIDFAKLGFPGAGLVNVFHPLYPDISFKLDSIVMLFAEYYFAIERKPNAYSLEGYKLMIQIRWFGLVAIVHYLISLFQQALIWLNMRLIENTILRLEKKSLEENSSYIQITKTYEQRRLNYKQHIKKLEDCLNELELKDAKLNIQPNETLHKEFDPITNPVKAIKDANVNCFSTEVLKFFEENFGFKLNEENKNDLEEYLEDFFSANEREFIQAYQTNHQIYLKA